MIDARPHIGSNRLPKVVTALRERLEGAGVEFRFGARVDRSLGDETAIVAGVRLADGTEISASAVVLATGHSARDVHDLLLRAGVRLEPKPFALGVRIEHPQPLINRMQYGASAGHPTLAGRVLSASRTEVDGRGVFSFCMCPGGFVVPAATEPGELVVNGMSLSRRESPFANSGLVVSIELEDYASLGLGGALAGVELQRRIESAAFEAGGGQLRAPATRATDFSGKRSSSTLPKSSYIPGVTPSDVREVLDAGGLQILSALGARPPGIRPEARRLCERRSNSHRRRDAHELPGARAARRGEPGILRGAGALPRWRGSGVCGRHRQRSRGRNPDRRAGQPAAKSTTFVISAGAPRRMGGPQ